MTGSSDGFETVLQDIDGIWPALPDRWSYSSLSTAIECPRRWMLSRASYPNVWSEKGYPPRPALPALAGSVIHGVLETVVGAFHAHGCPSVGDPKTVTVLKELGGYSLLLERAVDRELDDFRENPRAIPVLDTVGVALRQRIPEMRQRVQSVIARTKLQPAVGTGQSGHPPPGSRLPLGPGTHPEVTLNVPALRFMGRADLLSVEPTGCVITDYKTGSPAPHHLEQLRIYALLWSRDQELNPTGIPASELVISYATHDEIHEAPDSDELDQLESTAEAGVHDVEVDLARRPPPAKPAAEICRRCAVRHLCNEYWLSEAAAANSPTGTSPGGFVDCEGSIVRKNGPRSWDLATETDNSTALLRTQSEAASFRPGDRVRLLDVAQGKDDDSGTTILTMTQTSESYIVRKP